MNYSVMNKADIANGDGVRVSLFVSGCTHHCKGCFNPETWNFSYGQKFDSKAKRELFEALNKDYIKGLTLLGGDPLDNYEDVQLLCKEVKKKFPQKDIWLYTGYTYEEIDKRICDYVDVIVDGPFEEDKKDLSLKFRGSSNQKIIRLLK